MSSYQFLEIIDDEINLSFDLWLFHETKHAHLQSPSGWRTFAVKKKDEIVAQVRFHIQDGVARASVKSPFGTIQFTNELPPEVLFSFIQFYEGDLKKLGVDTIVLINPPTEYASQSLQLLSVSLLNSGYQISNAEIGCVITVKYPFVEIIDKMELRKLKKAIEAECIGEQVPLVNLKEMYEFILSCRREKGYDLSMTYEELANTIAIFPDRFILFQVRMKEGVIATSICVLINRTTLYNFYPAHNSKYDSLSPVVLLTQTIYEYCQDHGIAKLDLGTSALDGIPNFSLLDFKLRLGGMLTPKYTFQKDLK